MPLENKILLTSLLYSRYNEYMNIIQATIQTIWMSLVALGLIKVIIVLVIIGVLTRIQPLLGLIATVLFIAYLVHWI